jgi:hypothetical protein
MHVDVNIESNRCFCNCLPWSRSRKSREDSSSSSQDTRVEKVGQGAFEASRSSMDLVQAAKNHGHPHRRGVKVVIEDGRLRADGEMSQ